MQKTQLRLDNLTKPQGSLGRLEELAKLIVGITAQKNPQIKNKVIFTLAADHGVTEEGISAYPKEVTLQMVYNFLNGGAGINVLAKHVGARVVVVDMGVAEIVRSPESVVGRFKDKKVNYGTKNFTKGPAMSRQEAIKAVETGIELLEEEIPLGVDIVGTGEMGIGNTTASSAIASVFCEKPLTQLVDRGAGLAVADLKKKIAVIEKALEINRPDKNDPLDVLSKVGGFEIAGLTGIILASAARRIPVVIDGFISSAAALLAYRIQPKAKDYMIAAHCSAEKGHRCILEYMGLAPLLDLGLRLGEGTGAALAMDIVEASVKILTQMATFSSAKVSERIK